MKGCLSALALMVLAFVCFGVLKWQMQWAPYDEMRRRISEVHPGMNVELVRATVRRPPELACGTAGECREKVSRAYASYHPDPGAGIRGPTLVYRIAGMDHIHCLYFDVSGRLRAAGESTARRSR
jgi:hypothetical protein